MMSPDALRAAVLTVVVAAAAGVAISWDAERSPEEQPPAHAPAPDAPPVVPPVERLPQESARPKPEPLAAVPANGRYRCEQGGKTIYQGEPCRRGQKQTEVAGGTVSVVPAAAAQIAPRQTLAQHPAAPEANASFGRIAAPRFGLVDHEQCATLQRAIDRIDAAARQRSTDSLRHKRRELVREMEELKCETWPS